MRVNDYNGMQLSGTYSQMVRIFILAILAFALCSCADFIHLKPAADDDWDNLGHAPGSGDPGGT
jgi:hypothetical protein